MSETKLVPKLRFISSEEWKVKKIKEVFNERSEKGFEELELLSVTINDGVIKRSEIEDKDNSSANKSKYKHVLEGDIVYNSMRMWQGASGVSSYEGIVSPAYTILIPSTEEINTKFYAYYFKTHEMLYQFRKYSQGLTSDTWNLKYPLISEILIKIPSLEEQNKIVQFLSKIDSKIELLNQKLDQTIQFKKYLMQRIFLQESKVVDGKYIQKLRFEHLSEESNTFKLNELCSIVKGKQLNKSDMLEEGEYYVLNGGINPSGFTNEWNTEKNTISISEGGNSCGYVNFNAERFWSGGHCYTLESLKDDINSYYLYSYLKANESSIMRLRVGSGLPNIQKGDIENFEIIIPSKIEQDKIASFLYEIDNKINLIQDQIHQTEQFKKGLLQQMFRNTINFLNISLNMTTKIINKIIKKMKKELSNEQIEILEKTLKKELNDVEIIKKENKSTLNDNKENIELLNTFLSAKNVEGCSKRTIIYYRTTIEKMLNSVNKKIENITTEDLRIYLAKYKEETNASKVTVDNIRRVLSSFFSWLEDEDYILKNPVRRIHKIKTGRVVKEVLTDENFEILRDHCENIRDLAMIELLNSTGIRIGELVNLNIEDVYFNERECIVLGKGDSERTVYFDAKTKIHLKKYLKTRTDDNPALFVSFKKPYKRLGIHGIERNIRDLGKKANIKKVHPHKFRRTMATNAIDKGMPIEQVQRLLGHVQIDTTMQYAMVNQNNVKNSHRKYLS